MSFTCSASRRDPPSVAPTAPTNDDGATDPDQPPLVGGEPWSALAAWAADELGVRLEHDGKRYQIVTPAAEPEGDPSASGVSLKKRWFRRRRAEATVSEPAPVEPFTTEAPADVVEELVHRLADGPVPARPSEQPTAVHELAARLFDAYQLDWGQAHLAGCHFDNVPLIRWTRLLDLDEPAPRVEHRFFDELGEPLPWDLAVALGADRVAPFEDEPPRIDGGRVERMLASAGRRAGDQEPVLVTLVWVKRARGRLRFEFGDESIDTAFDGWASTLEAPPVVCPATGVETFHLAATDDGKIAAAGAIAVSAVTGRRLLASELETCVATGKQAEPEHFAKCVATGEAVLTSEAVACDRCGQRVAPAAKHAGDCDACRAAERVAIDPSVWKAIVAKHSRLGSSKWQASQTAGAYLLEASGWLRRHVVTIDRESLEVLHAAEASRFSSTWRPVAVSSYQ